MLRPLLIAGPTASGKSALARSRAAEGPSVVVNADSMQVYAGLRVLTARPTAVEEAEVPHRLFGHVPDAERYSVARWLADVAQVLSEASASGRRPIIVGGTGLYFRALTQGIAPVPPIPPEIRARWEARADAEGLAVLHRLLAERSPSEAARVRPSDRTRLVRALEVIDATGRTLAEWQAAKTPAPLLPAEAAERVVLDPPRAELRRRIDDRFIRMATEGGLEEARALAAEGLAPDLPAMKAIGLRPLMDLAAGRAGLDEAIARGQAETRQYAKRQATWLRHQMPGWPRLSPG
ncbi:MAG: tRNA (adenosine(37)-N6)-dimethylallyltransferase MiaA [Bauldia sp.]|nr:tRNA (adenosine(37)-N6)-dimethylallyltransferase MiaA [Bauldia sp.]